MVSNYKHDYLNEFITLNELRKVDGIENTWERFIRYINGLLK